MSNEYYAPKHRAVAWHYSEVDNPASFETNILQRIKHHSPTGMGVGYGGSGAADFALNILDTRLRQLDYQAAETKAWNKASVYLDIFGLHHAFKWTFIAIAADESFIEWSIIDAWVYAVRFDDSLGSFLKPHVSSDFRAIFAALYDENAAKEQQHIDDETARRNILCFRALHKLIEQSDESAETGFAKDARAFIARLDSWRARR